MTVAEKVAYLKGLAEGLGIDANEKEGKILNAVIDILEDVALEIEDLSDGLDIVSEDLSDVEELLFEDDEDELPPPPPPHHHHHGPCCADECCADDEDEDYEFEVECPSCNETIVLCESDLDLGEITCPSCGEKLEFEFDEDEDEEEDDEPEA